MVGAALHKVNLLSRYRLPMEQPLPKSEAAFYNGKMQRA